MTKTPSKHIPLKRLKQIKKDNYCGENGTDYDEASVNEAIIERANSQASKLKRDHTADAILDLQTQVSYLLKTISALEIELTSLKPKPTTKPTTQPPSKYRFALVC